VQVEQTKVLSHFFKEIVYNAPIDKILIIVFCIQRNAISEEYETVTKNSRYLIFNL